MSDNIAPPVTGGAPTTTASEPVAATEPAVPPDPAAVTSPGVEPTIASTPDVGSQSPTKKEKRLSGFGGFIKDLKKAIPLNKSKARQATMAETSGPSSSSSPAPAERPPHPGTIISDQSHTVGAQPVYPQNVVHPAHRGLLSLGAAEMLVTKEAEKIMNSMVTMVENSGSNQTNGDIPLGVRDSMYPHESQSHEHEMPLHTHKWAGNWEKTTLDKLFNSRHMGNYVIVDRQTGAKVFESMPIFTRLGMHLLFVSATTEFLDLKAVEKLFADLSVRQGKTYDNTDPKFVVPHIQAFIKTYSIAMDQLLEPDISKYKTFNAFFSRQLKPSARPVTDPEDLSVLTSPADSRVTVFQSVDAAKKFWIKGKEFSIVGLFDDPALAGKFGANPSIAIFRLAPQDYHRFHSPFRATLGKRSSIHGTYYTVNPQAINENLNVFTANHRDVQVMNVFTPAPAPATTSEPAPAPDPSYNAPQESVSTIPFVLVAVGAMLVGSIGWSKAGGQEVQKGEDLGFFQYGGSTTILVAPEGKVTWDEDLVKASETPLETLVRVGERIGKINF